MLALFQVLSQVWFQVTAVTYLIMHRSVEIGLWARVLIKQQAVIIERRLQKFFHL